MINEIKIPDAWEASLRISESSSDVTIEQRYKKILEELVIISKKIENAITGRYNRIEIDSEIEDVEYIKMFFLQKGYHVWTSDLYLRDYIGWGKSFPNIHEIQETVDNIYKRFGDL